QIETGRSATVVARINLEAGAPENATLRLSYQLPDATWQPLYDAPLDSEAGTMSLAQLGQVRQRTGEDWAPGAPPPPTPPPPARPGRRRRARRGRNSTAGSCRWRSRRRRSCAGGRPAPPPRRRRASRRTWRTRTRT